MAKKYRVKPLSLQMYPTLSTQIDAVPISLNGKELTYNRTIEAGSPPITMTAKPATQAQLGKLLESGNPHIEEIEDGAAELSVPVKP